MAGVPAGKSAAEAASVAFQLAETPAPARRAAATAIATA
jgi:hypothetical protein